MHPAKKNQIVVWRSFIPARTRICSDWTFTRTQSRRLIDSVGDNCEVPQKMWDQVDATRYRETKCNHGSFKSRVLYAVFPVRPLPESLSFNSARTLRANSIGRNGFSM